MIIDEKIIDRRLLETRFRCNLETCLGACCTAPGGSGPPIGTDEMDHLQHAYAMVRQHLPEEHVSIVEAYGLFEREGRGWAIRCYNRRACVFVVYDKGIAKCAIQDAYGRRELDWPKPQSCHLFPLRIRGKEKEVLEFETFSECRSALVAGAKENVSLIEFLTEAVTRVFGSEFHEKMKKAGINLHGAGWTDGEESSQC